MSRLRSHPGTTGYAVRAAAGAGATPSFLCRLVDDVVYWNTSRFSG
jgi:hypothetical protein